MMFESSEDVDSNEAIEHRHSIEGNVVSTTLRHEPRVRKPRSD